ncbi:MAG: hypothetical protein AB3N06_08795 [Erythrobacter sp.]
MSHEPWRRIVEVMLERSVEPAERAAAISANYSPDDRVCWHFMPLDGLIDDPESDVIYTEAAKRAFGDRDDCTLEFCGLGGFEVWDQQLPNLVWLRQRSENLAPTAYSFGAQLEGWSYEPRGYPEGIPQAFGTDEEEE